MTVNNIQIYEYRCDVPGCGSVHEQKRSDGHYWESVPPEWAKLSILHAGVPSIAIRNLLMCSNCNHSVVSLVHELKNKGVPT